MKARVLLADDHPRFPEMEARLLEPEFEVVGKVGNGQALIEEAMRLNRTSSSPIYPCPFLMELRP